MPAAIPIIASVAGAAVSSSMSDGGGSSQTATKDPWGPAQKPLTDSLATGQQLERYYQQNPFNQQQQTSYQNIFGNIDQFRNSIAPEMMGFANKLMGANYQRGPRNSQMEAMQGQPALLLGGQPMQGAQGPQQGGGLLGAMGQPQGQPAPQGLFSAPQGGSYGPIDWARQNPFNGAIKPLDPSVPSPQTVADMVRAEIAKRDAATQSNDSSRYA